MSYKIDALLKKVAMYERLAVYGNRKDFLRALAQEKSWDDVMKQEGDLSENSGIPAPRQLPISPPPPNLPPPPPPPKSLQPSMDKGTIELLQRFLNNGLKSSIIAGKRGPIAIDGIVGPETMGALKEWAHANGLGGQDITELLNTAVSYAKSK